MEMRTCRSDQKKKQLIQQIYIQRFKTLIKRMPRGLSVEEKLLYFFNYMMDNMDYDYNSFESTTLDSGVVFPTPFSRLGTTLNKEIALVYKKAISAAICRMFEDYCKLIGVECETTRGKTDVININENGEVRRRHHWSVVVIPGKGRSNIDISYGIFNRDSKKDPLEFFLVSDEELSKRGPHCQSSLTESCTYTANASKILDSLEDKMGFIR